MRKPVVRRGAPPSMDTALLSELQELRESLESANARAAGAEIRSAQQTTEASRLRERLDRACSELADVREHIHRMQSALRALTTGYLDHIELSLRCRAGESRYRVALRRGDDSTALSLFAGLVDTVEHLARKTTTGRPPGAFDPDRRVRLDDLGLPRSSVRPGGLMDAGSRYQMDRYRETPPPPLLQSIVDSNVNTWLPNPVAQALANLNANLENDTEDDQA